MQKQIGKISRQIIELLNLNIEPNTPIYISSGNVEHMKNSHPIDFLKYGSEIEKIIEFPDYVGLNSKDHSIEFAREYLVNDEFVKVAVRVSASNVFYARSLYVLNTKRVKNFITKGTLKPLDK